MLPTFTQKDVSIISRQVAFSGFLNVVRYHLRFRLFNGGMSQIIDREIMERAPAVGVLPYDPLLDRVVLIQQFRPGALQNEHPWLTEIIAGIYEKEEAKEKVALREAKEEAGCDILDLHPIADYYVSPGGCNEYIHLYCGRIDASQLQDGVFGLLAEEGEDIRASVLNVDTAIQWLNDGHIKTSPAIIALQWLQLNRERLKTLWQTK